jgi:twitching motility protein PilT
MSLLDTLVARARELGASDLHLEGGLPAAMRVQGALRMSGEPVAAASLAGLARDLVGDEGWADFTQVGTVDLSRVIAGVRCRINVLHSARGIGLAVRLLSSFQATLATLNLHPDVKKLVASRHGLLMVSGPAGCGKSSTVAAMLQEINLTETRHILTIESPIEFVITPQSSFIRQRQVGRDTPTFEQALTDAMREDPDVLMVGEMRDAETMRLTLNAAETGHLVITTVHSSSAAEALGRVVAAFPSEIQGGICAQLADCLAGVVCLRLRYREDLKIRIPECEILVPSSGVRGTIRAGQFSRLATAMEGGGQEGQWTWARYRSWVDARTDWIFPAPRSQELVAAESEPPRSGPAERALPVRQQDPKRPRALKPPAPEPVSDGALVIDDVDEDPASILEKLRRK